MPKCQQTWLNPKDFKMKQCEKETDRQEMDHRGDPRFVCLECAKLRDEINENVKVAG